MTYNELLAKINYEVKAAEFEDACGDGNDPRVAKALRAVVELHSHILYKNTETDEMYDQCHECSGNGFHALYPCPTIRVIEKALG